MRAVLISPWGSLTHTPPPFYFNLLVHTTVTMLLFYKIVPFVLKNRSKFYSWVEQFFIYSQYHVYLKKTEGYMQILDAVQRVSTKRNRSSRPELFSKKDVIKTFSKFTGKYQCWSLFLISISLQPVPLLKKRLHYGYLLLRTHFLQNTSAQLLLENKFQIH